MSEKLPLVFAVVWKVFIFYVNRGVTGHLKDQCWLPVIHVIPWASTACGDRIMAITINLLGWWCRFDSCSSLHHYSGFVNFYSTGVFREEQTLVVLLSSLILLRRSVADSVLYFLWIRNGAFPPKASRMEHWKTGGAQSLCRKLWIEAFLSARVVYIFGLAGNHSIHVKWNTSGGTRRLDFLLQ